MTDFIPSLEQIKWIGVISAASAILYVVGMYMLYGEIIANNFFKTPGRKYASFIDILFGICAGYILFGFH